MPQLDVLQIGVLKLNVLQIGDPRERSSGSAYNPQVLSQNSTERPHPTVASSQLFRLTGVFWLVTLLSLLSLLFLLPRSPLPWFDEIFFASTSLSLVRGGPPIPTVLGAFPHTGRVDLFYGPLAFFLGALDLRLFGLSATAWRLVGFLGAIGTVFSTAWVSVRLDRSSAAAAAAAMFVALSQGMGARATSGRPDTVTTMLELLSLAFVLGARRVRQSSYSALTGAAIGGLLCGMAMLSTPRSFPFVLGLFIAIGIELAIARSREMGARTLLVAVSALLPVWVWTVSQGTNPLAWLRFISATSRGDQANVSAIFHGSWRPFDDPLVPILSGLFFLLAMAIVVGGALISNRATPAEDQLFSSRMRLATVTVLVNYGVTFLLIARFWDYEIFVLPLVVPILTALTAKLLRGRDRRALRYSVLGSWLILTIIMLAIRSGKVLAWLSSYQERNPKPLQAFIHQRVPANSRVFGPSELYFYAVESTGSDYFFARPSIAQGLISKLDRDVNWREQLSRSNNLYLIWPKHSSLPASLTPDNLRLEGTFSAPPNTDTWWRGAAWGSGYPPTNLYRIVDTNPGPESISP